jgi:hypothetical protein
MATAIVTPPPEVETRDTWLPMIVIAMGQMLMSFNVSAIPVSMGGMVESSNARTRALRTGFLILSCLALLALVPCQWLPDYKLGEIPSGEPRK